MSEEELQTQYEHIFNVRFHLFTDEPNFYDIPDSEIRKVIEAHVEEVLRYKDIKDACHDMERWERRSED